ncbi:DUF1800 domain-containing protein [Polaromonas glacialis]|uniref:DUF1800 domain-containing protein n=1 Tax=Polaromonas glacialis TaxID=866564 RepID=UPI0018DC0727|nr:DUF1800 domain-containing protein [Polaromonas glacialis]
MPIAFTAIRCSIAILTSLAGFAACAQTGSVPIGNDSAETQTAWRASSRLGYAPTPSFAMTADAAPMAWALQQVEAAHAASGQAPAIPPGLARFNAPMADLARDVLAERDARKVLRAQAVAADTAMVSPAAAMAGGPLFSRDMAQSASAWRLMACSDPALEHPLLARMTEFWFNHLNVSVSKGTVRPFVGHYVVNAIRANALGRFEDLLLASARHPAMLFYLDQSQSSNRGLNENYARELMELHTLGVGGGYTQGDVHELARILTGWTVNLPGGEGFRFAGRRHDTGSKRFMGQTYHSEGLKEGEDAIRFLARQPATARRIAGRLATFFVADQPPAALVERLAATFMATQGDIRAVMRTLVQSPEFWSADNRLFKTPMDFACSALAVAGGVTDPQGIPQALGFLAQAGQPLHGWQTPDGYKTDAATWLAPEALTRRADFAMALARRIPEPVYLKAYLGAATLARVAREALPLRTGLMLASPDFMRK